MPVTNPHRIQAVTFHTETGRCNVHHEDGSAVVYVPVSQDPAINAGIMRMAIAAYVHGLTVSLTWQNEHTAGDPGEIARDLIRITLERIAEPATEGLIPWSTPREG